MKKIFQHIQAHSTLTSLILFLILLIASLLLFPVAESANRAGMWLLIGLVIGGNVLALVL